MKVYIVSVVAYDHNDNNLWHSVKAFADESEAQSYFEQEKKSCLADAEGHDMFDNTDDYYSVTTYEYERMTEYYRNSDVPEHFLVKLTEQDL